MKILVLCSKPPLPARDGGCLAHLALLNLLHRANHQTDVYCLSTSKHPFDRHYYEAHSFLSNIKPLQVNTTIRSLAAFVALMGFMPYNLRRFYNSVHLKELIKQIRSEQHDLIILDGINALPYRKGLQELSKKILYRSHNRESVLWEGRAKEESNLLKRLYLNRMANQMKTFEAQEVSACDAVLYISAKDVLPTAKPSFILPYTFTEVAAFSPVKVSTSSFFFLGAMDWEPNISGLKFFLEQIWKPFKKRCPNAIFHIAGRGMTELPHFLSADGVTFHGEVPDAKRFRLTHGTMVAPLFSGSGIRIKLLEAMLEGVPVMAGVKAAEGIPVEEGDVFVSDVAEEWIRYMQQVYSGGHVQNTLLNYQIGMLHYSDVTYLAGVNSFLKDLI